MSAPKKLRAGAESELTKLKAKWRGMSSDARSFWQELFVSKTSQADIRRQMVTKLQTNLRFDKQLNQFRAWVGEQELRDMQAEEMSEDELRFREQFPEISPEHLREKVLLAYFQRALGRGETGLGKAMLKQSLAERRFAFEQAQADKARRSDEEKALELILEQAKAYPEVQELFKAAFAALRKAKQTGSALTIPKA